MSIKAMTWVWEHYAGNSTKKLLMLSIADHAGDDGRNAYPSEHRLALRTNLSVRHVRRLVHELEKSGDLVVEWGGGRKHTNIYNLTFRECVDPHTNDADGPDEQPGHLTQETRTSDTETRTNGARNPDIVMSSEPRNPIEPSIELREAHSRQNPESQPVAEETPVAFEAPVPETDSPPPGTASNGAHVAPKAKKTTSPSTVSEEFRVRMREKHPGLAVDEHIDEALAHKAAKNWGNVELYVQNWLRREKKNDNRAPSANARSPARRAEINADPETYSFFGGR